MGSSDQGPGRSRWLSRHAAGKWVVVPAGLLAVMGLVLAGGVVLRTVRSAWSDAYPERKVEVTTAHGDVEVSLVAADGVRLVAAWHASRNGAAVVLAHGLHANRDQLRSQGDALEAAGFGVLRLDLRAHGRSGGDESTWGDRERLDVAAAVDYAAGQPGVLRVGALGFSIGALAVAAEALDDARVAAVVLVSMQRSAEDDIRSSYARRGLLTQLSALWTTEALGVDVSGVRPAERIGRLAPRPVLLVYGERDPVAPPSVGEELRARLGSAGDLWVMRATGHGDWDEATEAELDRHVVAFFSRSLLSPPAAAR